MRQATILANMISSIRYSLPHKPSLRYIHVLGPENASDNEQIMAAIPKKVRTCAFIVRLVSEFNASRVEVQFCNLSA